MILLILFVWLIQVEFMAEDELIEIVPNMKMDPLNFICVIFITISSLNFSFERKS